MVISIAVGGLLVFHEQGIGDELRFASCFGDLKRRAGTRCMVECDPRLITLFSRGFPELCFIGKLPRDAGPPSTMDYSGFTRSQNLVAHTALGELGRHLRPSIDSFPKRGGYLTGASDKRALWRETLDVLGPGRKIGFSWTTGLWNKIYAGDFFDILDLAPVFALPNTHMVNLQYGECEDDLRRADDHAGIMIHRPAGIDLRNDLDDLAALIGELDLVIGPATSVIAMAGAIGTPCIGMARTLDWPTLGTESQPWTPEMSWIVKGSTRPWARVAEYVAGLIAEKFDG